MLDAAGKLGKIVLGMNRALGDIPVTVKLRSGVKDGKNTAHKLMPRLGPDFGVSAITVGPSLRSLTQTCSLWLRDVAVTRSDETAAVHQAC